MIIQAVTNDGEENTVKRYSRMRGSRRFPWRAVMISLAVLLHVTGWLALDQAGAVTYTYDELSRVIKVEYDDGSTVDYGYDEAGNILTQKYIAAAIPKSLRITSPNGGQTWQAGTTQTVQWTYTGEVGDSIKLDLLKGGSAVGTINSRASVGSNGSGSHEWSIPSDQAAGGDYAVRATSLTDASCTDTSDAVFTITASVTEKPNLAPYQPQGWSDKIVVSNGAGSTTDSSPLYATDTLYVDWAVLNNGKVPTSEKFYIALYVDGTLKASWYSNPPLAPNYYVYVKDYSLGTLSAGSHTLKLIADSNGGIAESEESDNEYSRTIQVQQKVVTQLTLTSPNGGQKWRAGARYVIRWSYTGNPGPTATVQLLRAGIRVKTISSSVSTGKFGKGSLTWRIPRMTAPGGKYRIKIISNKNKRWQDASNANFTILKPALLTTGGESEMEEAGETGED
jgi:YD repeat-containing protein